MQQKVLPELMIISLVRANTSKTKVACAAAMVNMLVKDTATEMILEGLIWCLTQLASLPSELLVKAAASAFATIVENDDSRKTLIDSDKGINSLMSLMRTESEKHENYAGKHLEGYVSTIVKCAWCRKEY